MLVLSRRTGEELVIIMPDDSEIVVKMVEGRAGRATVGITAPTDVTVLRREVMTRPGFVRPAPRV